LQSLFFKCLRKSCSLMTSRNFRWFLMPPSPYCISPIHEHRWSLKDTHLPWNLEKRTPLPPKIYFGVLIFFWKKFGEKRQNFEDFWQKFEDFSILGQIFGANIGEPCDYRKSVDKIRKFLWPPKIFQKSTPTQLLAVLMYALQFST